MSRPTPTPESGARTRHPTSHRPPRRRSGTFVALLALIVSLNLLGLVMVLSASSVTALDEHGSSWYITMRQGLWMAIGLGVMLVVMRTDYHRWRRWSAPLLGVSTTLLVLVLVPGIGMNINGASRWLGYGSLSLQPSELAKLAVLVWVADLLARRAAWISDLRLTVLPVGVVFGGVALLMLVQPNLGTTLVLAAMVLSLLYVAGTPLVPLTVLSVTAGLAASLLALGAGYRRARLTAFFDPWDDPLNTGYQNIQSLVGLAEGGITGTGLGASRAKWGFLPYAHTDFIYSIIGEELGLLGAVAVVALFVAVVALGVRTALLAPDRFGMLVAIGATTWFGVQAFVNIGAVVGILPITGVPLPFVSYGGSSLVFSMIAAGLLLSVARQTQPRSARVAR
jgi:cell division protein FtsW